MSDMTEMMIYEMAFRVRLYIASKLVEEIRIHDLNERESLLLEIVGIKGSLSISEICNFYPSTEQLYFSDYVYRNQIC